MSRLSASWRRARCQRSAAPTTGAICACSRPRSPRRSRSCATAGSAKAVSISARRARSSSILSSISMSFVSGSRSFRGYESDTAGIDEEQEPGPCSRSRWVACAARVQTLSLGFDRLLGRLVLGLLLLDSFPAAAFETVLGAELFHPARGVDELL